MEGEGAAGGHCIAGIDGQVEDHLLYLPRVGKHGPQVLLQLVDELDVLPDERPEHRMDVLHHRVQADPARGDDLLPAESEKLPRETRGAASGREDLPDLRGARVLLPQPREEQVGVPRDGGEDVVEVVSHSAGQPADGLHLLRVAEALFQLHRLGHVPFDRDVAHDPAILRLHRADGCLLGIQAAILAPVDQLAAPDQSGRQGPPHPVVEGLVVAAALEKTGPPADGLITGVTGYLLEGRIDVR